MKRVTFDDGVMYVNLRQPEKKQEEPSVVPPKKPYKRYLVTGQLVLLAFTLGYLAGAKDVVHSSIFTNS